MLVFLQKTHFALCIISKNEVIINTVPFIKYIKDKTRTYSNSTILFFFFYFYHATSEKDDTKNSASLQSLVRISNARADAHNTIAPPPHIQDPVTKN